MSPNPTDFLITPDLNKPEGWTYPINHTAIKAMADRVGRESDKTTKRLSDVVAGRTVALLLNGGSIKELEYRIWDIAKFNICFVGINRFSAVEHNVLFKVGEEFGVIFCMSEQDIPLRLPDLEDFLARDTKNLLITTLCAMTWLNEATRNRVLDKYGDKLYLMPRLLCRPAYPISLEVIIDELIKVGVGRLILFGADGYLEPEWEGKSDDEIIKWSQQNMLNTYYDPEFFKNEKRPTGVGVGTVRFNRNFKYQPERMEIINCLPNSKYAHIPKMSYDELLEVL